MRIEKLRGMTEEDLKKRRGEIRTELMKAVGFKKHHNGGYERSWHPPFSDGRKLLARIETVLGEKRRMIGEKHG
jgi:ribosomal protein L29